MHWDKRWEKPGKHVKFDNLWLGPYIIDEVPGTNSFFLNDLEGEILSLPVNGFLLKMFFVEMVLCHYWHRWFQGQFLNLALHVFLNFISHCCIIGIVVL